MKDTFLIVTSIADQQHPILNRLANDALKHGVRFITIGDTKSPDHFQLDGCDFYSIERQKRLPFTLVKTLPEKHYARKNLGYLLAISQGATTILETDDDNWPMDGFWANRNRLVEARSLEHQGWVNVYGYFTDLTIWPRGFALDKIQQELPEPSSPAPIDCPIQQGLADENPDVDAIYRLTLPLPVYFRQGPALALGQRTICPFNSQNTTWFADAFPLMYLPSYCSFRMTDIWRSFVAQRIAWCCGWSVLFHGSTVRQERNDHNLMSDFRDEVCGYQENGPIVERLNALDLKPGVKHVAENMVVCYRALIEMGVVGDKEMDLLRSWLLDVEQAAFTSKK